MIDHKIYNKIIGRKRKLYVYISSIIPITIFNFIMIFLCFYLNANILKILLGIIFSWVIGLISIITSLCYIPKKIELDPKGIKIYYDRWMPYDVPKCIEKNKRKMYIFIRWQQIQNLEIMLNKRSFISPRCGIRLKNVPGRFLWLNQIKDDILKEISEYYEKIRRSNQGEIAEM